MKIKTALALTAMLATATIAHAETTTPVQPASAQEQAIMEVLQALPADTLAKIVARLEALPNASTNPNLKHLIALITQLMQDKLESAAGEEQNNFNNNNDRTPGTTEGNNNTQPTENTQQINQKKDTGNASPSRI